MRFQAAAALLVLVLASFVSGHDARADGRVLFLADSHALGLFGDAFERELLTDGSTISEIETHAVGGAAPSWFYHGTMSACGYEGRASHEHLPPQPRRCHRMRTPYLSKILRRDDTVVVAMGTNLIIDPLGWTYARDSIARMARSIHEAGAACIWIGPPHMRRFDAKLDAFYGVIEAALKMDGAAPCPLVDSRDVTAYPSHGGDGIHYSFPAGTKIARAWGREAAARVRQIEQDRSKEVLR